MVDGQPDLSLGVEHAAEVAPGNGEVGSSFYGFQITCLIGWKGPRLGEGKEKENQISEWNKHKAYREDGNDE